MASQYRIRWGRVLRGHSHVRMCIAERKTWLGLWWPCGEWVFTEGEAERAIDYNKGLRAPLPAPRIVK